MPRDWKWEAKGFPPKRNNVYTRHFSSYCSYKVIAAVLVPTDSEMKRRSDKRTREDGKDVPESAVMEMKANFKLPDHTEDFFDEVRYVELSQVLG